MSSSNLNNDQAHPADQQREQLATQNRIIAGIEIEINSPLYRILVKHL